LTKFKQENNTSNKLGKVGGEVAAAEPEENIRKVFAAARCAILICDNQELLSSSPKAGA
jgi:hypothetical protein